MSNCTHIDGINLGAQGIETVRNVSQAEIVAVSGASVSESSDIVKSSEAKQQQGAIEAAARIEFL